MASTRKHRKKRVKRGHEFIVWYFKQNMEKTLKDIAAELNISVSVVSRVTTKHYEDSFNNRLKAP